MSDDYYIRTTCRLCDSDDLELVLCLEPTPLCDAYLTEIHQQDKFPLNLLLCKDCSFVQIDCVVNSDVIYRDYTFVTTSSLPLQDHFGRYADDVINKLDIGPRQFAIDIGSNEGTLLQELKDRGLRVLGIEPATDIAKLSNKRGIETVCDYFSPSSAERISVTHGQADLVTINNVFANIDDLTDFVSGLVILVKEDGYVVIESSYLPDMLENMIFDFIYHEHLSYLSIKPLANFFKKFGFRLVDVDHVDTKGGSMRYYFRKTNKESSANNAVKKWMECEESKQIYEAKTYRQFEKSIALEKTKSLTILDSYPPEAVVGYGASATTTTLMYHFELGERITCLVDDNPAKIGTYSPGHHLPVYDPNWINQSCAEVVYVFAWRYASEIIKKQSQFSGKFVIPLPRLKII